MERKSSPDRPIRNRKESLIKRVIVDIIGKASMRDKCNGREVTNCDFTERIYYDDEERKG